MNIVDGRLVIFDRFRHDGFRHDESLPKWRKKHPVELVPENVSGGSSEWTLNQTPFRSNAITVVGPDRISTNNWNRSSILRRMISWLLNKLGRTPKLQRRMTVQQFFASVKDSVEQIAVVNERAAGYAELLAKALSTGQKALYEQLIAQLDAVRSETQLLAIGMTKTISEQSIIALNEKSPRGIRLDWIVNFARPIPDQIVALKRECDERQIFDNYVVMHYDPEARNAELTNKEKEAVRDPILFGVLEGSRKLYFVGDWIDEQCDLTLDKVAELIGKDAVQTLATEVKP